MRVFLSWSGPSSRAVAVALYEWLPTVVQAASPWMSKEDIGIGARWATEISGELDKASYGIVCLTPDNLLAPWILFESGALSKKVGQALVSPYLLGLEPTNVAGPLSQFQMARADKEGTKSLVQSLNNALDKSRLDAAVLEKSFNRAWTDLRDQLQRIEQDMSVAAPSRPKERDIREILEELLDLARAQERRATEQDAIAQKADEVREALGDYYKRAGRVTVWPSIKTGMDDRWIEVVRRVLSKDYLESLRASPSQLEFPNDTDSASAPVTNEDDEM